ncbi:MAG: hypothetical protein Q8T08_07720 [Ignavibacteria bacterium]|nr:hypothetical protein [Ignavibacteria bacterium]
MTMVHLNDRKEKKPVYSERFHELILSDAFRPFLTFSHTNKLSNCDKINTLHLNSTPDPLLNQKLTFYVDPIN